MLLEVPQKRNSATAKIVTIYTLFGLAWIYGSDTLLGWMVHDPEAIVKIAVIKGSLFIVCTATLLFFLISRFIRKLEVAESGKMESLKSYQAIFNATNEAIFIHDAQTARILDINDRMLEMYVYTRDEALSLDIWQISEGTTPYSQKEAIDNVRKAMTEGPQVFEWLCRKKTGELFWTEVSLKRVTTADYDRIIAVVRDISERKQVEEAVLKERNRAQGYLDTVEAIIVATDTEGRITTINRKACQIFGYSEEELLGLNWYEACLPQPDGKEVMYQYFLGIISEKLEGAEYHENPVVTRSGELRHIAWHNAMLRDEHGQIYEVLSAGEDITERKIAEKALKESNDKIMGLVDSVPGHVAFVNADKLTYEFVNMAFEKSFGIPRDKIIGSHVKDIVGEANFQFALKYIEEAKCGKSVSYENTFNLASGKRWIQVNYNPVIDSNNQVVSLVVLSYDITKLKEHELEQLKIEKLESLGILAGGIAHDFNNILTGIMGNISLAKVFIDDTHKAYNALVGAETASVRASELARQLLTFARGGEPVKKVVSVQYIVNEAVSLVLHGSNVKSVVDVPDSIHAIEADEGQLSQVLHNLIINATQAMPGGGTLTVVARNEVLDSGNRLSLSPGPYVRLTLSDEGCGISNGNLTKIFDPYFTTKSSGSGLGLASANSIITRHHGHIGVSSEVGKGTTFTIHLPSMGDTYADYRVETNNQPANQIKGGSILVMDDEEMIRDLATGILEELGYQVTTCDNGKDAITQYIAAKESGAPFLAVIMDLTIPGGMGGKEAAKEIIAADPTACLIVSSGYSDDPIMSDYKSFGFSESIAKPYGISELANKIRISIL